MPTAAAAPEPDDESRLFVGRSRQEVAKRLGMNENTIRRIEARFRLRLAIELQKDPKTRHLAPRDFQDFIEKLDP
jgi:hypothetical protein